MDVKKYCAVEKLKDGCEVVIRTVRAEDKDGFARGFEQLSGEAIYRRFFSHKKQLSEEELKTATEIDFVRVIALVAEIGEDGEKKLIGACRYVAIDDNDTPRRAEVAFTLNRKPTFQTSDYSLTLRILAPKPCSFSTMFS